MERISDALELLTSQHQEIHCLLSRASTTEDPAVRGELVGELAAYVTAHLAIEQELFYAQVSAQIAPVVMSELFAEHAEIKRVLADLLWLDGDDERFTSTIATMTALIEGHSLWQDEELFPTVAETASEADLAVLGGRLQAGFDSIFVSEPAFELARAA